MKTNGKNVKRYLKCLPNAVAQWSKTVNTHKVNENILHLKNRNTNKHSKKKQGILNTILVKYYLCRKKPIEAREKMSTALLTQISELLNNSANLYSNLLTNMHILLIINHG